MKYCVNAEIKNVEFDVKKEQEILNTFYNAVSNSLFDSAGHGLEHEILDCKTLKELCDVFGFAVRKKQHPHIYVIRYYFAERWGNAMDTFCKLIAPFNICKEGYIEWLGEDGERWRYLYENGICKYQVAEITWVDDED